MTGRASGASEQTAPDHNPAIRQARNRSRALAALLLCALILASSCATAPSGEDEAAAPKARAASEAEINRAARSEDAASGNDAAGTSAEDLEVGATAGTTNAGESAAAATFVHRATRENSQGDYTYLSDPSIDGDPNAAVFAAPSSGEAYDHNIGVWYEARARKWAIFNQDLAPVPAGTTFDVVVPHKDERFVQRSGQERVTTEGTYLDHPLVNGKPGARLSVTQNWKQGGGNGVYNDHPVGVRYYPDRRRWEIFNEDGSEVPKGAAFNVTVSAAADKPGGNIVRVDTGAAPDYEDFFSEGQPQTPGNFVSSDSSTGAIPVVRPFNFGRDPGGPDDKTLSLTIPKLDLEGVPVFDSLKEEKLRDGAVHIPATGYPWQEGANVYVAGHRIGYEGTRSDYVFFHLDQLEKGDEILVEDAAGKEYRYRVVERSKVGPENTSVMNAQEGRSLLTLQTCTLPDYEERLIVQAELVQTRV